MAVKETVKGVTDDLYEVGEGRDKVRFHVRGKVYSTVYIDKPCSGEYEIPVEIDATSDDIAIDKRDGYVEVTVWVS